MKKTTQIHIGGQHFMIDEDAFQKLSHYIESLKLHFAKDGETGKEIVEDIEQRIAEIFSQKSTSLQSVTLDDVNQIINTLGNVDDFIYEEARSEKTQGAQTEPKNERRSYRRLYRDPDQKFLGGVASGLAQYFDTDPVLIRLAFIALIFLKGFGILLYLILWMAVPKARNSTEKLQMKGKPVNLSTIQETIQDEMGKVKTGSRSYASGMESFLHALGLIFVAFLKFILIFIGILSLIVGSVFLAGLLIMILGFTNILGATDLWPQYYMPEMVSFFQNPTHYYTAVISLIVLFIIPIIALIYGGIKILFHINTRHPVLRAFLLTSWILAFILFISMIVLNIQNSPVEASDSELYPASKPSASYLVLGVHDNLGYRGVTHYRIFHYGFHYNRYDETLYNPAQIRIGLSHDQQTSVKVLKRVKNVDAVHSDHFLRKVDYNWMQQDSLIRLDQYFQTDEEYFWMFPKVEIQVLLPPGQQILMKNEVCEMLNETQKKLLCRDSSMMDKIVVMKETGELQLVK